MRELYNKVISSYQSGDNGLFRAAVINWMNAAESADFTDNEGKELFFTAKRNWTFWHNKAINAKISKERMIECVRKIAEKNLPNPYPEIPEIDEEDPIEEKVVEAYIESPVESPAEKKEVKAEEPKHVLGVVPQEETKHFFNKRKKR